MPKGLEFHTELPEATVHTLGDASALRRLLLIVIDNAVKYTQQGEITVRVSSTDGNAQVQVSDTGLGIHADDLSRVFERFYRADKSRSRDSGGAGLGLSIAKWIAEVHQGAIEARSEHDRGSTFIITLPGATAVS